MACPWVWLWHLVWEVTYEEMWYRSTHCGSVRSQWMCVTASSFFLCLFGCFQYSPGGCSGTMGPSVGHGKESPANSSRTCRLRENHFFRVWVCLFVCYKSLRFGIICFCGNHVSWLRQSLYSAPSIDKSVCNRLDALNRPFSPSFGGSTCTFFVCE